MKKIEYIPLSQRVLVVAVLGEPVHYGIENKEEYVDWTAYIDAVSGYDHDKEYMNVAQHGSKLPEEIAKILFPEHAEKYRWRR